VFAPKRLIKMGWKLSRDNALYIETLPLILLIPQRRIFLQKLTVAQPVKKFPRGLLL
jgi:hypothetical protein